MYQQLKQAVQERTKMVLAVLVKAPVELQELVGQRLLLTEAGISGSLADTPLGSAIEQLARQVREQQEPRLLPLAGDLSTVSVFFEPYHPVARLLILGGGHVARPLAAFTSLLDYEITVVDDRPSFANPQRFPEARSVVCDDFIAALQRERIDACTSVVIITRGHKHDVDCLKYVLQYEPGYVGMIGSRRRAKLVREHLSALGYPDDQIGRVNMPIGLEIGGETPAEIAASIVAQLVANRHGLARQPVPPASTIEQWSLLAQLLDCIDRRQLCVAATVIHTLGSTPRKAGARLLVLPDGSRSGTVGGGCGEAEVCSEAMMLFGSGRHKLIRVPMDADVDAEEGMSCGGAIDVFLERIGQ